MLAVTRSPHQQLLEGERCVTLNAGGLYLNALFFFFCRLISTQGSSEWNLHDKNSQFIADYSLGSVARPRSKEQQKSSVSDHEFDSATKGTPKMRRAVFFHHVICTKHLEEPQTILISLCELTET